MNIYKPIQSQYTSEWSWKECSSVLMVESEDKVNFVNLKPSSKFKRASDLEPFKEIQIEKKLNYNDKEGWNWHKSWTLPSIKITLNDELKNNIHSSNPNLAINAKIYSVIPNKRMDILTYFQDIGIKGKTSLPFSEDNVRFSGLKFSSTSYNKDGLKFHLLLVLSLKAEEGPSESIITSRISPPIFVDSRKSARIYERKDQNEIAAFGLFHPELFFKSLFKRKKMQSHDNSAVNNSLQGLLSYITAANIRNKVKHPFFLAVKFSKIFDLYFNEELAEEIKTRRGTNKLESLLNVYEKLLKKFHKKKKHYSYRKNVFNQKAIFSLVLKKAIREDNVESTDINKVINFLTPPNSLLFNISQNTSGLSENYSKIEDFALIESSYKKFFSKRISEEKQSKKHPNAKAVESDEDDNGRDYFFNEDRNENLKTEIMIQPPRENPENMVSWFPQIKKLNTGKAYGSLKTQMDKINEESSQELNPSKVKAEFSESSKNEEPTSMAKPQSKLNPQNPFAYPFMSMRYPFYGMNPFLSFEYYSELANTMMNSYMNFREDFNYHYPFNPAMWGRNFF